MGRGFSLTLQKLTRSKNLTLYLSFFANKSSFCLIFLTEVFIIACFPSVFYLFFCFFFRPTLADSLSIDFSFAESATKSF